MPRTKFKILSAMFDIKPVDEWGNVDISKFAQIQPVLNLGRKFRISRSGEVKFKSEKKPGRKIKESPSEEIVKEELITHYISDDPQSEFESYLNQNTDLITELASIGAKIHQISNTKYQIPKKFKIQKVENKIEDYEPLEQASFEVALAQIYQRIPRESQPAEGPKMDFLDVLTEENPKPKIQTLKQNQNKSLKIWLAGIGFGLIGITLFGNYGSALKKEIVTDGSSAVQNLQSAGENIKKMDFSSASGNFTHAYQDFAKAGDNLNFMGAGIGTLLSDLPGAGKLKSAKNLVEAGKLMADAGKAMSDAMGEIAKTNLILNPLEAVGSDVSIGQISTSLKKALTISQKNLGKAKELLADVDDTSIPEDKRTSFLDFKSKLPLFEKLINDSVDYSKFLEDFIGTKGFKRYLVMFQNPSELRPTGGFPGTYAVVSFKDGKLLDFKVDDVYNIDGQLQELIVPPLQLQHITPNWGMRDANWFVDFPTSARKIIEFYKKESHDNVDGVITFSPTIVAKMLDAVGPVEMPEYNLTLDSKNLFSALQDEVEYKADRKQPKKIVMDLAPKLLKKLYSAPEAKWLEVFNLLVSSMDQKDILMYFRDLNLESFSVDKGFSGQVKNVDGDYLMVNFTNVKGSKTDMVVDSAVKILATEESGAVRHKVSITRTHNGGQNKYGFYNKQSPTYVRILVPENAEFVNLIGNSRPGYKPLIGYDNSQFKKDEDLAKFEEGSYVNPETGVTIYKESGKTEFGFWMVVDPGETKTAILEYSIPSRSEAYQLYVQKQPSANVASFKFYMNDKLYFDGRLDKDMVINSK